MTSAQRKSVARHGDDALISGVDAHGRLFPIDKLEAHRRGVRHLAISVFVFRNDEMLIQKRAAGKYHSPGLWANACCSHPNWGESFEAAAHRRLREELGLTAQLTPGACIDYDADVGADLQEIERVQLYRAAWRSASGAINANPQEVCETRWIAWDALLQEVAASPDDFAPWFRIYLARWSELGLDLDCAAA